MEDSHDFQYYMDLIEKEKAEEEIFQSVYGEDTNKYLINLNNFTESSFKIHTNICIGKYYNYKHSHFIGLCM